MELFAVENLNFTYPNADKKALDSVSFSVREGEFLLICGLSGCGKTTLLRQLKTVLSPAGDREGIIKYGGEVLDNVPMRRQTEEIGFVLQNPDHQIVTDKVWHEMAFGLENLGYPQEVMQLRVAEMANFFGIQNWFHESVHALSGGQKQMLNLASVMALSPKVLILDEPTAQLDPIAAEEFLHAIEKIHVELGTTVIMIEHRMDLVMSLADRVIVMEDGRIFSDETPVETVRALKGKAFYDAMPIPAKVHGLLNGEGDSPLTVNEGRRWFSSYMEQYVKIEGQTNQKNHEEIDDLKKLENQNSEDKVKVSKKVLNKKDICIKADEIYFKYNRKDKDILVNLNLEVERGKITCILGGNGVGKSTMLSVLAGIKKPYRGSVFIEGHNILKKKDIYGNLLCALPQNPQTLFLKDTVMEDLKTVSLDEADIMDLADKLSISHLLAMHPYDLSGGEQQRAALCKVLLNKPKILFLDEPTKGFDGFYKKEFAKIICNLKDQGITILMVSHDIEFCAAYADSCALFFDGHVAIKTNTKEFFRGNSFYTTAVNRMVRDYDKDAVTMEDLKCLM